MSRRIKGSYIHRPLRGEWAVYKVFKKDSGEYGEVKIQSYPEKEDAAREMARLNGWKIKEKKKNSWFEYFRNSLKK